MRQKWTINHHRMCEVSTKAKHGSIAMAASYRRSRQPGKISKPRCSIEGGLSRYHTGFGIFFLLRYFYLNSRNTEEQWTKIPNTFSIHMEWPIHYNYCIYSELSSLLPLEYQQLASLFFIYDLRFLNKWNHLKKTSTQSQQSLKATKYPSAETSLFLSLNL